MYVQDVKNNRVPDIMLSQDGSGVNSKEKRVAFAKIPQKGDSPQIEENVAESIASNATLPNIVRIIGEIESRNPEYYDSREAIDTARAVLKMANGTATKADFALIERSEGARTVVLSAEGTKAWESLRAEADKRMRSAEYGMRNDNPSGSTSHLPLHKGGLDVRSETPAKSDVKYRYAGKTKSGIKKYVTDFPADMDTKTRENVFKERIKTIFNLGAVKLNTDAKKILIEGDRFTVQKNLYGDEIASEKERQARINSLYDMAEILSDSKFIGKGIEESYKDPTVKPKNQAHKDVKYWYKFKNTISMDGVIYDVVFNIRDKGKQQYQYLIEFHEKNRDNSNQPYGSKNLRRTLDELSPTDSISKDKGTVNSKDMQDGEIYSQGKKISFPENKKKSAGGYIVQDEVSREFRRRNQQAYNNVLKMAKDLKKPVMVVKGLTNGKGQVLDGILTSEGIIINTESENPLSFVATHEFSHLMKKKAPKEWRKYQRYVINKLKNTSTEVEGVSAYDKKYAEKEGKYEAWEIDEEIACDYIGELFSDEKALAEFIKADRSFAVKIRDFWYSVLEFFGLKKEKVDAKSLWMKAYKASMNKTSLKKTYDNGIIKLKKEVNWRTDLNRTEYKQVEMWIRQAGIPEAKRITDTACWYKGRLNSGEIIFAIYSTEVANDPTILYERRGKEGEQELDILLQHLEEIENGRSIVDISKDINTLLSSDWLQEKHNLANNDAGLGGRGSNTGYASVLQGKSSKFIGSQAFRNVVKNIFDIQEERVGNEVKKSVAGTHVVDNPSVKDMQKGKKDSSDNVHKSEKDARYGEKVSESELYSQGKKISFPENKKKSAGGYIVQDEVSREFQRRNQQAYNNVLKMAKDLKKPVMVVKGLTNGKGQVLDGILTNEGIIINAESENPLSFVATHEFSHLMKKKAPKEWRKYQRYVINKLKNTSTEVEGVSAYDKKYAEKEGKYKAWEIDEEIACDYIGELFSDEKALAEFIKADRSFAVKIRDFWYSVLEFFGLKKEKVDAKSLWMKAYKASMNKTSLKKTYDNGIIKLKKEVNWRTDLNRTEYRQVEMWIRQAGIPEAKRITDTACWYKGRLNSGEIIFAIYSTEVANDPTILYERRGKAGGQELDILMDILEDEENGKGINGKPSFTQRVSQGSWLQNVNNSQNNLGNLGRGQNNQNARVLQSQSRGNGSPAFWSVVENLFKRQEERAGNEVKKSVAGTRVVDNPSVSDADTSLYTREASSSLTAKLLEENARLRDNIEDLYVQKGDCPQNALEIPDSVWQDGLSEAAMREYEKNIADSGISMEQYIAARDYKGTLKTINKDTPEEITPKEQMIEYIGEMNISDEDKKKLYLAMGYSEKNCPW